MSEHVVIGGGPSGLMAAEVLSAHGQRVTLFDRMPTVGRKFLMAGRGGLNLTHSEPFDVFVSRYGAREAWIRRILTAFDSEALVSWAHGLGQETFIGSSGRVFPKAMKASPLLRAWLRRLEGQGVSIVLNQTWRGWYPNGQLKFSDANGREFAVAADSTILALGGASWPKLGSKADWITTLGDRGVRIVPFRAANCGFFVDWSAPFKTKFAGEPIQGAAYTFEHERIRGESVVTRYGIEGGAIYALSSRLRAALERGDVAMLFVDLRPEMTLVTVQQKLSRPRGGDSLTNYLRKTLRLAPVAINLLREAFGTHISGDAKRLGDQIKAIPIALRGIQGVERAISSAGGIDINEVDDVLMLKRIPGVHVAGEMLDWEAPTGGYLLQACFAMGVVAAQGALARCGSVEKTG